MISLSFIGVIILTAYVTCLSLTNLKTDLYKSTTFKLNKSSDLKRFRLIAINRTNGHTMQDSSDAVNALFETVKQSMKSGE